MSVAITIRNVPDEVRDELAARAARAGRSLPYAAVADRAWALRANLTAHDASYVALAETLASPLVALDARLARANGVQCKVLAFSART